MLALSSQSRQHPGESLANAGAVLLAENPGGESSSIFNSCSANPHIWSPQLVDKAPGPRIQSPQRRPTQRGSISLSRVSVCTGWALCTHVHRLQHRGRRAPLSWSQSPRDSLEPG